MRALLFTPEAVSDLEELFLSIAADNPVRARTYVEEIQARCRGLCATPMIGVERPDLRPALRIFPLWKRIVVAYEVSPDHIDVLRVLSGRRDYEALLRDQ